MQYNIKQYKIWDGTVYYTSYNIFQAVINDVRWYQHLPMAFMDTGGSNIIFFSALKGSNVSEPETTKRRKNENMKRKKEWLHEKTETWKYKQQE